MSSPMAPRLTAALMDRYRLERELGRPTGRSLNIVLHWFDQLRAR